MEEREEIEAVLALSPEQQENDAVKGYKENLIRWLGEPRPEQETLAIDLYNQLQPNDLLWLKYRESYQAELRELFEEPDRGEQFSKELFQLLIDPEVYRSQALNRTIDQNIQKFKLFLLNTFAYTTEKQRNMPVKEIEEYIEGLVGMMQK